MSQNPEPGKVVKLGDRQVTEERGGELLRSVRSIALGRLQALVSTLFENVDDALFDLAEKAENNAVQTQFFDGMREVRKKRQLVERMFHDHLNREFSRFASGKPPPHTESTGDGNQDGELSLVDDRELEESLAVTSMISKAENRYARLLYTVNQRLSVISGGTRIDDAGNPFGPAAVARCFRLAMRELEADVRVKLIIYKLFERYVLAGMEPLYDAVNIELVRQGVLPQLRHRAQRKSGSAAPASSHAGDSRHAYSEDDEEQQAYREQLYETVNSLLARRRSTGDATGFQRMQPDQGGYGTLPSLSAADLLAAINVLQRESPVAHSTSGDDGGLSLAELKNALRSQLGKSETTSKAQVSGADEDTIDLVGMLFEYILADRNLPTPMQAQLGRLQLPYLKVAILDRHLFAQKSHPARRLLDAMAEAAKSWTEESDRDQRLYNEIKNIINDLVKGFDDDTSIFDRLLSRFEVFTAGISQRASVAEQRAAEATRGREKLQAARRQAAREVLSRTQANTLPPLVQSILTRPWANYLVLTLLRQGEKSAEWRAALRFIDDLIRSTQAAEGEAERKELRAMLPGIEKQLRLGLSTVAFHESDVRRLLRALGSYYHTRLGGSLPDDAAEPESDTDQGGEPIIPENVEAIAVNESADTLEVEQADALPDDTPGLAEARALKVGNWIEYQAEEGTRDRAKLSWVSPISGKYLFVNRRGLKVCDMTLHTLAESIAKGSTVVLEEVPLFDRALDAIVERLKKDQSRGKAKETEDAAPAASSASPASEDPESKPAGNAE